MISSLISGLRRFLLVDYCMRKAEQRSPTLESAQHLLEDLAAGQVVDIQSRIIPTLEAIVIDTGAMIDEIARLEQALTAARELADRDPLCPVLNRRAFRRELDSEISRATRHNGSFSLLFVDLDKFKAINDTLGHDAGDRVLIAVATALVGNTREHDTVGRLGGDEFAILLPGVLEKSTTDWIADIKAQLSGSAIRTSVSVGVATWRPDQSADQLLALADKDMFAKKSHKKLAD